MNVNSLFKKWADFLLLADTEPEFELELCSCGLLFELLLLLLLFEFAKTGLLNEWSLLEFEPLTIGAIPKEPELEFE
jgi:hypothetical protein